MVKRGASGFLAFAAPLFEVTTGGDIGFLADTTGLIGLGACALVAILVAGLAGLALGASFFGFAPFFAGAFFALEADELFAVISYSRDIEL